MFHEHRELISELKQSNNHFARLFQEHNDLDAEISRLENEPAAAANRHDEIEQKKRKKLKIKDEIYDILRKESIERDT